MLELRKYKETEVGIAAVKSRPRKTKWAKKTKCGLLS
jgi:hypothetical protein